MTPIDRTNKKKLKFLWWQPGANYASNDIENFSREIVPNIFAPNPRYRDDCVIYKLHGGLDPAGEWQDCIITENDYFEFGGEIYGLSKLPFRSKILNEQLAFFGYSLNDIHVKYMFNEFLNNSKKNTHYLVNKNISKIDRIRFYQFRLILIESTIENIIKNIKNN